MSIKSEIERISGNIHDVMEIIAGTGVAVGSNSDTLPTAVSALVLTKQDRAYVEGETLILPIPTTAEKQANAAVNAGALVL